MDVYRTLATREEGALTRWGVTFRRKWYVSIARLFLNLREKYAYQREYNQYLRDLDRWKRTYTINGNITGASTIIGRYRGEPLPLPPPERVIE